MPDTPGAQLRYVRLFDATWMVLDHPRMVTPTFETVRSCGYWHPVSESVTCPNGHTWLNEKDHRGLWKLPAEVTSRYRVEVYDPDLGEPVGHDPYWVCPCGEEISIRWGFTGEVEYPIQTGWELWPTNQIEMRLVDGPASFAVQTVLGEAYTLQDADGADVCKVMPGEWGFGSTITLTATIVGPPQESLTGLLRAVYGADV